MAREFHTESEIEEERLKNEYVVIPENSGFKVAAYCFSCRRFLFAGDDATAVEKRVLIQQLNNHLDAFRKDHVVNVIHPERKTENIINAEDYLDQGARGTAIQNLKFNARWYIFTHTV